MFRYKTIITGILLAGLLYPTALEFKDLTGNFQLFIVVFGVITLLSLSFNIKIISTISFGLLLGTMLYISYFYLFYWIIGIVNPNHGTVLVNGVREHIMDMSFIPALVLGLIFSVLTMVFYQKMKLKNRNVEITIALLFTIIAAVIYIKQVLS